MRATAPCKDFYTRLSSPQMQHVLRAITHISTLPNIHRHTLTHPMPPYEAPHTSTHTHTHTHRLPGKSAPSMLSLFDNLSDSLLIPCPDNPAPQCTGFGASQRKQRGSWERAGEAALCGFALGRRSPRLCPQGGCTETAKSRGPF